MLFSPSEAPELSARHHAYSRKQKSLGLLCTNFLNLYSRGATQVIGLDEAASKLGVERRRIYDIVNVLESVGVLARKAKNQYTWKGFDAIPKALRDLKEEGLRENPSNFDNKNNNSVKDNEDNDEDDSDCNPNTGSQNDTSIPNGILKSTTSRFERRKEKSLGLLTQNFVKLFLCANVDVISLDDAAKLLLGDAQSSSVMRTKVRRLYDIANVLSSMELIEKTHTADTRKPAFRWLGLKGKSDQSMGVLPLHESRKRAFGTDVTNICFKRNKIESLVDEGKCQNPKENQIKADQLSTSVGTSNSDPGTYQFGPFAPKVYGFEEKVSQTPDLESLASTYRPEYHNQALRELFVHYMEAWKSWYSEVTEKKPIQIS
ncbi:hypothetical protein K2173_028100 [Erythroxylum novogranatense]|uniref:E2F/DP family winged-helix DNA-binding domain-containing protein n=1 Tax=Erythroxylum novogranatense TaxID=1862640 RepID=A0AAV8U4U7_9ROSI|nr:hypothetical protein K2173_028100 [Erythroxylum novogranatense]